VGGLVFPQAKKFKAPQRAGGSMLSESAPQSSQTYLERLQLYAAQSQYVTTYPNIKGFCLEKDIEQAITIIQALSKFVPAIKGCTRCESCRESAALMQLILEGE
jgi:hypothetical protein